MDKLLVAVGALALVVAVSFVTGWITMLAWNETMPYLFTLPTISFMQGFWLNTLAGMLLKSNVTNQEK